VNQIKNVIVSQWLMVPCLSF